MAEEVVLMNADTDEVWVVVKKVNATGQRYIPKGVIGRSGRVIKEVTHHGVRWKRVLFTDEPYKFTTNLLGYPYYDFTDDEIEEIGR